MKANLSRVPPGLQVCVWGAYRVEERDNEAGRGYISAEASAEETKCRDARALHLRVSVDVGAEWLGVG